MSKGIYSGNLIDIFRVFSGNMNIKVNLVLMWVLCHCVNKLQPQVGPFVGGGFIRKKEQN